MSSYRGYTMFGGQGDQGLPGLANMFTAPQRGASMDERLQYAQQMYPGGRQVGSNWVYQSPGGVPISTSMQYMNPPQYRDPWAGPTSALLGAFLRDSDVFQGAADRQFARNNAQIGMMDQSLTQGMAGARGAFDQAQGIYGDFAGQLAGNQQTAVDNLLNAGQAFGAQIPGLLGPAQQGINQGMDQAQGLYDAGMNFQVPDLQSHAMVAYDEAKGAVDQYAQDRAAFERASWDDAQSIAEGLRSQMQDAHTQAYSKYNVDGTPKTAAQAAADATTFARASQEMVSSAMTQFSGKIRDTQAQMANVMAGLGMQAADFRGKVGDAAATEAQLELGGLNIAQQATALMSDLAGKATSLAATGGEMYSRLADFQLQAEQMRAQYDQFQQTWNESRTAMLSSFPLAALGLEMQGRQQVAALVQQNPESYISWFEGLLGLYSSLAAARGTTRVA